MKELRIYINNVWNGAWRLKRFFVTLWVETKIITIAQVVRAYSHRAMR